VSSFEDSNTDESLVSNLIDGAFEPDGDGFHGNKSAFQGVESWMNLIW
jgi:hypothetical protein